MSARSFLDTNILAYTDDADAPEKQSKALEIVERCRRERTGVVSTQVLQEYFVTATKKLRVPTEDAKRKAELFGRFSLFRIELDDILAAIDLHRFHQFSLWGGLVIRAALQSGCSILFSEDLQTGRRLPFPRICSSSDTAVTQGNPRRHPGPRTCSDGRFGIASPHRSTLIQ